MLAPILRAGDLVDDCPALDQVRRHTLDELDRLADPVKRLVDPEVYQVGVESGLRGLEQDLIRRIPGPAPHWSVPCSSRSGVPRATIFEEGGKPNKEFSR